MDSDGSLFLDDSGKKRRHWSLVVWSQITKYIGNGTCFNLCVFTVNKGTKIFIEFKTWTLSCSAQFLHTNKLQKADFLCVFNPYLKRSPLRYWYCEKSYYTLNVWDTVLCLLQHHKNMKYTFFPPAFYLFCFRALDLTPPSICSALLCTLIHCYI